MPGLFSMCVSVCLCVQEEPEELSDSSHPAIVPLRDAPPITEAESCSSASNCISVQYSRLSRWTFFINSLVSALKFFFCYHCRDFYRSESKPFFYSFYVISDTNFSRIFPFLMVIFSSWDVFFFFVRVVWMKYRCTTWLVRKSQRIPPELFILYFLGLTTDQEITISKGRKVTLKDIFRSFKEFSQLDLCFESFPSGKDFFSFFMFICC